MATRMQQRRGTAAQWISTDGGDGPVLQVGEIGFESDTGKFKVGDGTNHWIDLPYFIDEDGVTNITGSYVETSTLGAADGVATLDNSGNVPVSQLGNIIDAAPGALDTLNELAAALNDDASFATTVTNSLAEKASLTGTETLTNKTITGALNIEPVLRSPEERWNVSATAATGTVNFDAKTSGITYYTSNASGNWTLNIRGDGSTTLDSMLETNDSITIVFFVTNGSSAYYQTGFQIDGNAVTPKWQNGSSPSSGNANSIDIYSYTIVKTGSAAFTAFGSQTKFA